MVCVRAGGIAERRGVAGQKKQTVYGVTYGASPLDSSHQEEKKVKTDKADDGMI